MRRLSDAARVAAVCLAGVIGAGDQHVQASGGGRRAPAVGGYVVGTPVVVGVAPVRAGHWGRANVGFATAPALGVAYTAAPALGYTYTAAPALGYAYTAAPTLGYSYTAAPALGYTYAAAPALGVSTTAPTLGYSYAAPTLGGGQLTVPTLGVSLLSAGSGGTFDLGSAKDGDAELILGNALGGERLNRIKDRIREVFRRETSDPSGRPRRSQLIQLLTNEAIAFARTALFAELGPFAPLVERFITDLVKREEAAEDTATNDLAPTPSSTLPSGARSVPVRASGRLIIDRIYIDGKDIEVSGGGNSGGNAGGTTSTGGTTNSGGGGNPGLLPGEGD